MDDSLFEWMKAWTPEKLTKKTYLIPRRMLRNRDANPQDILITDSC